MPVAESAAVVLLPAAGGGRLAEPELVAWLSRADLARPAGAPDPLGVVLELLGLPQPAGLAALRMWGQTGERPSAWVAAADPVYLEPRLDHLCLHALAPDAVSLADLRGLFDHLQAVLAGSAGYGFARIGRYGYLRADRPLATAAVGPAVVDQQPPNDFLPAGPDAAAFRGLVSEVEMAIHDHPVNANRQAAGLPPVNSLWLWGGGHAPESVPEPPLPLFADEPLATGIWRAGGGTVTGWPGSIAACSERAAAGFVAMPPAGAGDAAALVGLLAELRTALEARRVAELRLVFADGLVAQVRRGDRLRFWRRRHGALA